MTSEYSQTVQQRVRPNGRRDVEYPGYSVLQLRLWRRSLGLQSCIRKIIESQAFANSLTCNIWLQKFEGGFLVNNQIDAQFFLCIYFSSLYVSSNPVLIIRRINCINTSSGICHSVSVAVSCASQKFLSGPAHETVTDTEWHKPEVVLIQLILLMISTELFEICRELK